MKKTLIVFSAFIMISCGGRTKEEQKAYEDSLFHVISCSPTIVAGPYTLEDQLNACDLLIKERPEDKEEILLIKDKIQEQIAEETTSDPIDDL